MKGLTVVLSILLVLGVFQGLTRVKAEQKIEIRFSGWGAGSVELASYQKMFEEFEEEHPQYKVMYEPILENYPQKIAMMFRSGTAPDVFYVDSSYAKYWIKTGYLLPIDKFLEEKSDFVPELIKIFEHDEKLYGIPKDFSVLGMFYNKEMFKKANIEKPPETWDELLVCAQKLKEELGIVPLSLSRDLARWLAFIYQTGAEIVTPGHKESLFTDPKVVESLEFYTQFEKMGLAKMPGELGEAWNGDAFAKEKVAIIFEGNWLVPFLKDNFPQMYNKTGVAPLPRPENGKETTLAFVGGLAIYGGSEHPEAAWKLIDFLTSKEGQKKLVIQLGHTLPSRASLREDPELLPLHKELMLQYPYARVWALGEISIDEIATIVNPEIEAAIKGIKTPKAACATMKRMTDEIIKG